MTLIAGPVDAYHADEQLVTCEWAYWHGFGLW